MRSVDPPSARRSTDSSPSEQRLVPHMVLAGIGLFIFLAIMMTSGRIAEGEGLGWDGRGYASLMTDGLDQDSVVTRSRPFIPLVTRLPYAVGLGVIQSFELMNVVYAFTLYLFVALILDLYGAPTRVKAIVIGNLALCVATSKMFAYYPVQIDLGVFALMTAAFYFVMTDRHWLAGAVCVLALASREFAIAVLLCGIHRTFRRGRLWPDGVWYLPGAAMAVMVRTMTSSEGALSASDAVANLALWLSPLFVAAFVYFGVTVFGGISALLVLHPRWCIRQLREEPELVTFLVVILGLSVVGSLDIWRYLAFALPVVIVLIASYHRDRVGDPSLERSLAAAMTFITVITQRPFEQMNRELYFRDWFPLYNIVGQPTSPEFLTLWAMRLGALLLLTIALASIARSRLGLRDSAS